MRLWCSTGQTSLWLLPARLPFVLPCSEGVALLLALRYVCATRFLAGLEGNSCRM